jgi:hypothetical protein
MDVLHHLQNYVNVGNLSDIHSKSRIVHVILVTQINTQLEMQQYFFSDGQQDVELTRINQSILKKQSLLAFHIIIFEECWLLFLFNLGKR